MLEIFFEKKSFFQLKELEKIAPKEKGITPMSVKEVLQSLVDDNLVDAERIGTSNYFWAYPSKALHKRKQQIENLDEKLNEAKRKKEVCDKRLQEEKCGRDQSEERTGILKRLHAAEENNKLLCSKLTKYAECDPATIQQVEKDINVALEAANRWTDNIFSIKSWCSKKFNMDTKMLDKQFQIPEDFDYVESV